MNIYVYTGGGSGHFSGKSALSNSISGNDYDFSPIRRSRNNFFVSKLGRIRFPRRKEKKGRKEYRSDRGSVQLRKKYGKRDRENTTRFFMVHLILRSIFGVKIFP